MRTLLVVPSLEIKKQLQASMDQYFGKNNKNLRIENIDSKGLKDATDYDCLIIDECHHAAAKTYQTLNKTAWKGIYRRYFLTATFFRNQEAEQLLFESIAGDVIFELTYREAVAEGIVRPVESYYVTLPKRQVEGYTWAQVYKELVVQREDRNALIADLIALLNSNRIPTLCLVKEIEHGNLLSKLVNAPFVNGQDEDSRGYLRDFNEGKIKALIGTTGVLGEGVDTKPAEYIIVAGLGKAKSAFMQWVGRGVRNYPGKETCKVIIFDDPSHKWTKSHFKTQKEILIDEYGVEPVALKE
jgi:superfamily II DNA or RNA helicase